MESNTKNLQEFEALVSVPEEQLQWLEENSTISNYTDGEFITEEQGKIEGPHFILEGKVYLFIKQGKENREIGMLSKGRIYGYLPYSRSKNAGVNSKAVGDVKIMTFNTDKIREMIHDHFELTQALVHLMNNRVRDFTAFQQQNDKMAALGKMAAGLAHEINNPTAALVSDSLSLREHQRFAPTVLKEMVSLHLEASQIDEIIKELSKILSTEKPILNLKERSKKEEIIADWLDERNIENGEDLSEIFVDFNFSMENLKVFDTLIPKNAQSFVFNWFMNILGTEKLIQDIETSSRRIAELIKSIKIYTHMDRGSEKMASNIHDSIRNTLSILGYKLRKGNVELDERYDQTLPLVMAYTGQLNQVWTNLIDNALDSMEINKKGKITITTERDGEFVKISINDDGPGIPENIKSNIFDPFFTTKEIGKGTGMGLETVQRIILKHNGSVKVESVPGSTTFIICIPISNSIDADKN
ncbi:ATP-binding protein [Chryseobacterium sp. MMS23-Vi53]|uniref:ATP-binding protein n=1 Tax=Chryseobacterium sp. MMS23-Vi53 TaxID=3386644 RepID=UPI0039EBA204